VYGYGYLQANYLAEGRKKDKQWLLETFLGPDSNGAYRAMIAALINETDVALTCLRRWPDLAAEVLRECSAGAPPVRRHGFLYQRLSDHSAKSGPPVDVIAIHAVKATASAVQAMSALTVAHVHICGEGCAGKSETTLSLQEGFHRSVRGSLPKSRDPIPLRNRTLGMVSATLDRPAWLTADTVRVLFHDYGGQEEFRANHATHLAAPSSVYVLVVPLWDMRPKQGQSDVPTDKFMDIKVIEYTYTHWLKFITTVIPEDIEKAQCITVLNFRDQFTSAHGKRWESELQKIATLLQTIQGRFAAKLSFPFNPVAVNSINSRSVHKGVVPLLRRAVENLANQPVPMAPAVQTVLDHKEGSGKWPLFSYESDMQALLREAIAAEHQPPADAISDSAVADKVVRTIVEITQARLQSRGDIIVFSAQSKRISINRPNWLTEQLLGSIFDPSRAVGRVGLRGSVLTSLEIAAAAMLSATPENVGNTALPAVNVDPAVFGELLHHIGACIPVTLSQDETHYIVTTDVHATTSAEQYFFPAFSNVEMPPPENLCTGPVVETVIRRYKVQDAEASMIPPGYYPSLFVAVASAQPAFQSARAATGKLLWVYRNGMKLEVEDSYRVVIRGDAGNTSFDLEVEVMDSEYSGTAFDEMTIVRGLIVEAEGWRGNVRLQLVESCVHPRHGDSGPTGVAPVPLLPMEDKVNRKQKLGQLDSLLYYGHRDGRGLTKLKATVDSGFARVDDKLDNLAALAKTEFTSLSAHVKMSMEATQRAEAGDKAVLEYLLRVLAKAPSTCMEGKAENATEGQDEDVEAQLWAERAQEFLNIHTVRLQEAELKRADQLSSMKEEILEAFRTAVEQVQEDTLKKLEEREATRSATASDALKQALSDELVQLQRSVTEGQEVQRKALQQLAAKVDTSAPSELHRELQHIRKELQIVRTVQNNTLYGVYDVPLLPVITRYEGEGVLDAVKSLAYETWTLHFACPVCAQPAPSGPNGKGYKLQATHAWVRRVNKAVALGLKALSVMSLLGPVPLPGLVKLADYLPTGSLDKLTEGAEKALKNAQKILKKVHKGANTSAQAVGELSDAATAADLAATLSPVRVDLDYVRAIREVLLALKETPPGVAHAGLERVICEATKECAWVCKTCKGQFQQEGVACQRIKMGFA
jgi:hypothetical protein